MSPRLLLQTYPFGRVPHVCTGKAGALHGLKRRAKPFRCFLLMTGVTMTDPLALICSLPDEDRRQRLLEVQSLLQKRSSSIRVPDGVVLEWPFSAETAQGLLDFVLFERGCCASFCYELQFPPPHTSVRLRITAPAAQVEALQAFYC